MSEIGPGDALTPYLNPRYWGGHSLGYGEPTRPLSFEPLSKDLIFALESSSRGRQLLDRVSLMHRAVPVESLTGGEVFDPEAHEIGTLVIFRGEVLNGDPAKLTVDPERLTDQPLPARPLDVSPNFDLAPSIETAKGEAGMYATRAIWGIVSTTRTRGHKVLHTASTGGVYKTQHGGQARSAAMAVNMRDRPIEIGATEHGVWQSGKEVLERVNALDVVAYGQIQKRKQWIGGLAAKLAPGRSS